MIKTDFYVVGVMSGTSLDGVDLVYAKFEKNTTWKFEIIHYSTLPYPKFWKESFTETKKINGNIFFQPPHLEKSTQTDIILQKFLHIFTFFTLFFDRFSQKKGL